MFSFIGKILLFKLITKTTLPKTTMYIIYVLYNDKDYQVQSVKIVKQPKMSWVVYQQLMIILCFVPEKFAIDWRPDLSR